MRVFHNSLKTSPTFIVSGSALQSTHNKSEIMAYGSEWRMSDWDSGDLFDKIAQLISRILNSLRSDLGNLRSYEKR